ncbi:probable protein phosphatase 2C 39 [Vigna radiata var. radiata]|uniref:Probable protein phosphatase 2C 39 n=1 Tax=Vigna radiata var. radiata TaxID=3916 RepID=A0A1S3VZ77_VIGRR|nr:probable protein phosphatase 2C 39 [Vigna radiata var. radiata]
MAFGISHGLVAFGITEGFKALGITEGHKAVGKVSDKQITDGLGAVDKPLLDFWKELVDVVKRAYSKTYSNILEMSSELGRGGSTAVTTILVNCQKLIVANIGDYRVVLCKKGVAKELSVDHEPNTEYEDIKNSGGFVSNFLGDVPQVDGRLTVSRAFGDKSLKKHLSSKPFVTVENINVIYKSLNK